MVDGEGHGGEWKGLRSVMIPDSVLTIDSRTFEGCPDLETVVIGDGVTNIGEGAFAMCPGLENVVIGNGVTTIGPWAFSGCSSLRSLFIPESVASIGERAFDDCTSLEKLFVPASWEEAPPVEWEDVVSWWCEIVYGTHWFYDVDWDGDGVAITGVEPAVGNLVIPSKLERVPVTRIETNAFEKCDRLTS
jgi:hypothetical protein